MGGARVEIWFPRQEQVSVFLETAQPNAAGGRSVAGVLFTLFASRTLANLGSSPGGGALAMFLSGISHDGSRGHTPRVLLRDNDVDLIPAGPGRGRKGFVSSFDPDKAKFFAYKPHGFGLLGRGADFYGPMAVFAFLAYLFDENGASDAEKGKVEKAAYLVGRSAADGLINVVNQHEVAASAARAAGLQ